MEFKISCSSEEQLTQFVKSNFIQFPLDFRKMCETTQYTHKLYTKALHFECWEDDELIGLLCAYVNDEGHFAYVPYLCISVKAHNKGIASRLLEQIYSLKGINYVELEVRISNKSAYNLYRKKGFTEISRNKEKIQLRKNF